jgi:uncharacterized membrane protein YsdA (DUF1294 family)
MLQSLSVSSFEHSAFFISKLFRNFAAETEHMTQTIVYILIGINVLTFLVYGIDKWKAKQGSWRIPEATLLMLAVIGGSIGALLGMRIWHHKTMHKKFKYGLPLILLLQVVLFLTMTLPLA